MDVILATCSAKPELTQGDALLAQALEDRGAVVLAKPWDDIDPTGVPAAAVCLRSTWDYHRRWPAFRSWIQSFVGRTSLWNPPETVIWNADKVYLRHLSDAGIAIPPTRWFEAGERPDHAAVFRELKVPQAILKPRVSATAYGTYLISPDRRLDDNEWAPLDAAGSLLQAFVPEVQSTGEVSLVFIDGSFTHAVRKRPAPGDYRVQGEFGGSWEPVAATKLLRDFAETALEAAAHTWLYARVDVVETHNGPILMELELIEPDLFLAHAPNAAARLADALIARASRAAAA